MENVLVDRSVVNGACHDQRPVYQFERIGYFCLDSDSCSDQVDKPLSVIIIYIHTNSKYTYVTSILFCSSSLIEL